MKTLKSFFSNSRFGKCATPPAPLYYLPTLPTDEPIPPLEEMYLRWPGKEEGKPKPSIIWIK